MNHELDRLAREIGLEDPENERLRLLFGHACVSRAVHLLESDAVRDGLAVLGEYLEGRVDRETLELAAGLVQRLARQHPGSKSLDGCGHAAVSASYAVAKALAGKALQAAEYAAYAVVYGQGGYGAVADLASFEPEFAWQVERLRSLAVGTTAATAAGCLPGPGSVAGMDGQSKD
jgi:hypothetical protein